MSRSGRPTDDKPLPPLYAMTHGGIESTAADEITRDLGGEVKKTSRGLVVFRLDELSDKLLSLRTTEDVFLLAWGSDSLSYKSDDLETLRNWTARKPDWEHLFKLHHKLRPKTKGKPTYHIVCQMQGEHGYRRADARAAFTEGLSGKIPRGWHYNNENAWLEIWLTIYSKTAVCGVRLSDRTMRHRTYKMEHVAASQSGYVRVHRKGQTFETSYSADGKTWEVLGSYETEWDDTLKLGVFAENDYEAPFELVFAEFALTLAK